MMALTTLLVPDHLCLTFLMKKTIMKIVKPFQFFVKKSDRGEIMITILVQEGYCFILLSTLLISDLVFGQQSLCILQVIGDYGLLFSELLAFIVMSKFL